MKALVLFSPSAKYDDFEGARLRKNIKNALEVVDINHTSNVEDTYDVAHLISPIDDNVISVLKEKNIPIVVSALYCEDDTRASYINFENKKGEKKISLTNRTFKFLNEADLVLVPTDNSKQFLIEEGITSPIEIQSPGGKAERFFEELHPLDKDIFFRYFKEPRDSKIVLAVGEYENMDGISALINAGKKCPEVSFYFIGRETLISKLNQETRAVLKTATENIHFLDVIPDDVFHSLLMNAHVFMVPSYKPAGIVSISQAMLAKCQLIVRKQKLTEDWLIDEKNAHVAEYSETLASLTHDYLQGNLTSTVDEAYNELSSRDLNVLGNELIKFYKQAIGLKK